ncbi:hypothetical protein BD779DRAFT_1522831 [Infundibulicybe gibba]|nr:hypothetical protein BD779DRAFT_1522831 [Infundibulicybe gibba]
MSQLRSAKMTLSWLFQAFSAGAVPANELDAWRESFWITCQNYVAFLDGEAPDADLVSWVGEDVVGKRFGMDWWHVILLPPAAMPPSSARLWKERGGKRQRGEGTPSVAGHSVDESGGASAQDQGTGTEELSRIELVADLAHEMKVNSQLRAQNRFHMAEISRLENMEKELHAELEAMLQGY